MTRPMPSRTNAPQRRSDRWTNDEKKEKTLPKKRGFSNNSQRIYSVTTYSIQSSFNYASYKTRASKERKVKSESKITR